MSITKVAYLTVGDADAINGEALPWDDQDTAEKEEALKWSRLYIENTYSVSVDISDSQINSALKDANAILANEHLSEDLFLTARNAAPQRGLIEDTVKATPVGSTIKYDPVYSSSWVDPFPGVTSLLASAGFNVKKGGLTTVPLLRR